MLRGEDHRAEAAGARGAGPLPGVETGGREDPLVFVPVAPLAIGKGIDTEMDEERALVALPFELGARGNGAGCWLNRREVSS
jgi:hypothetical protein